jgi:hypothetical protein
VRISDTFKGLAGATVVALALAAPAVGAPAGNEYVPQVPSATGDKPVDQGFGGGGTTASTSGGWGGAASIFKDSAGKDSTGKDVGSGKQGDSGGDGLAGPVDTSNASSSDDSSGVLDTLLNPLVLLLIGGVLAIAVGMTLARRQGGNPSERPRPPRLRRAPPPTPDGEIVAADDGPH